MIKLSEQSTKGTGWRNIANMGLVLLFAFLINVLGTSGSFAHSSVTMDGSAANHGGSIQHEPVDTSLLCHLQDRANQVKFSTASHLQENHQNSNYPEEHDCNTCCPFEMNGDSSAYLRSKHDRDMLALSGASDQFTSPVETSLNSISHHDMNWSQPLASQLSGLSGAQAQFLHTIRLLA